MSDYNKLLEEIGLTKSEIKVYLALLELGSTTTGPIVEKSKVASSKIYEILEKLMQKGLASFVIKSGTKHFAGAEPNRILDFLSEKSKKLENQTKRIQEILPELKLKKTLSKYKSKATIYKGLRGVETAFYSALNLLSEKDEMLVIGIPSRSAAVNRFFVKFGKERNRRKIRMRAIFNQSAKGEPQSLPENNPLAEIKYIPETTPAAINIFNDRVLIYPEIKEPLLIQIDSKEVAESFRVQFEMWWEQKVKTYQGAEAIKNLFRESLEFGDYVVFTEGMKVIDTIGEEFFTWWQNEKKRRGIKSRGIMGAKYRNLPTATKAVTELKFLPTYENPGATLIFQDRVIVMNFSKNPTAFVIEDRETADNQRTYFELVWNQDTTVVKGKEAMLQSLKDFVDDIDPKDTFNALGATFGIQGNKQEYADIFKKYHDHRIKKGIHARLLFQPGAKRVYEKNRENYGNSEIRFLPYDTDSPVSIHPYKDKTMMIIQEKIPTTITINNKEITQSFLKHFESLWNQETIITKGFTAFEDMIKSIHNSLGNGDHYSVLGAGVAQNKFAKKYEQFFNKISKHRIKKKVNAKLLFEQNSKKIVEKYPDNYNKYSEVKFLPYQEESPVEIFIEKDKAHITIQEEEPTVITINNKTIAQSFQKQFDSLWQQKTRVVKGLDAIQNLFEEFLETGEANFIGARGYFMDQRPKYIEEWTKRAIKQGFKMRNIVDFGVKGHKITNLPFAETKYTISKEFSSSTVFWIYGEKVVISSWVKKDPVAVIIESKTLNNTYRKQFEELWNQDTASYKGFEETTGKFEEMLNELNPGEEYYVLGASIQLGNSRLNKWLVDYHTCRVKKGVNAKLLSTQSAYLQIKENLEKAGDTKMNLSELRALPSEFNAPFQVNLYKDKVHIFLWDELRSFEIKSKILKKNFQNYFDSLWGQETQKYEGIEGLRIAFSEALAATKSGETSYVYGASTNPVEVDEVLHDYNQARAKKGVKLQIIFTPNALNSKTTRSAKKKHNPLSDIKFMPQTQTPASYEIFPDRVIMKTATKKNPVALVIKNKDFVETHRKNFLDLWNQKTFTFKGEQGVKAVFDQALKEKEVWAIGGNDGIKKYFPEYWTEWDRKRTKKKIMFHDLIDTELMDQLYDRTKKIPSYEFKVLPKELSSPHVIWIFGNKVANIIWDEKTSITITEDKEIANSYKNHFNYLWKIIK